MTPMERTFEQIDAALWNFQWAYPDRGQNRGEVSLDREKAKLCLRVWVMDNDDPEAEEAQPLDVSQDVFAGENAKEQIRSLIHGYLCHEADEQMWFDGERPFYPHDQHLAAAGQQI